MDIFSAPDGGIELVGVMAVVVILSRPDGPGIAERHRLAPPGLIFVQFFRDMDVEVRILHFVGFLEIRVRLDLLKPDFRHQSSRIFLS